MSNDEKPRKEDQLALGWSAAESAVPAPRPVARVAIPAKQATAPTSVSRSRQFQSEIRNKTINELLEKVEKRNYGKYLVSIKIPKARAFRDQTVKFDFPVTAVIGPNGGGKTTVLGAAACAYQAVKPSQFLAKSGKYDASMLNWSFEYEVLDQEEKPKETFRRTASFTRLKWSREGLKRSVSVFGVARTVPATERKELRRCISGGFVARTEPQVLTPEVAKGVALILDKDVSKFGAMTIDAKGKITLLAGESSSGDKYSEFHFGAGESSIIRLLVTLENLEKNALVLIEEIENGLHPAATVRLVEHLIALADEKGLQVIFTTHSDDALKPLPDKAIWAAVNGCLFQGKLDIKSLRAVTGQVDTSVTFFVEDKFSKMWMEAMLRSVPGYALDAIGVHAMQGDGIAKNVHIHHNKNPTIAHKSVCILDGDSQQSADGEMLIFRLPGQSPEAFVYDEMIENLKDSLGQLTVMLLRPFEEQNRVEEIIRSVRNTNRDPHLLFSQVGKQLGFLSEERVQEAFVTMWARSHGPAVAKFIEPFEALLPKESDDRPIKSA